VHRSCTTAPGAHTPWRRESSIALLGTNTNTSIGRQSKSKYILNGWLPANPGAEPVLMDVPLSQGTKPITTRSAGIRGGWTGGAPEASTLAMATPITSRIPPFDAMAIMGIGAGCSVSLRVPGS